MLPLQSTAVPDGLLIIDKPGGPTSHDVVARVRRALREKAIGHTGTLDPMATGVLVLVIGKATRLAKFLSAGAKSYEATVRFGFATDTADAQGRPIASASDRPMPSREEIDAALDAFRGTFMQQPPAFSAKKIDGQRSYKLARDARLPPPRLRRFGESRRSSHDPLASEGGKPSPLDVARDDPERVEGSRHESAPDLPDPPARPAPPALPALPALPAPASVTAHAIRVVTVDGDQVTLQVDCSAGFYVRSLAHDLGERLGVGAHLTALRRTRVGEFGLDRALTLDAAERDPQAIASSIVPLAGALPDLPAVVLTTEGAGRVSHGQDVRPGDHVSASPKALAPNLFVRLLDARGALLAIAEPAADGALHPSVVLV